MIRPLLVLAAACLFISAADAAVLNHATLNFGGKTRDYLIEVPSAPGPKPLVIALHGIGGTGEAMAEATRLAPLGQQQGFVAVFPDALVHQWNWYRPGETIPAVEGNRFTAIGGPPDDFGFLKALIADLVQRGIADPKRVYLVGFSNGGFMTTRMACDDAGAFAAIALISSSIPTPLDQDCHPAKPLPIVMEKGTADDHVPYNGGYVLDRGFTVISADQLSAFFIALDGCGPAVNRTEQTGVKNVKIDVAAWAECKDGPVTLYKVNGGVHTVYQLPPPAPTLWDFFKTHRL